MKSIFISFLAILNFLLSANLIKLASIILVPNILATEIKAESKNKLKIESIAKEITVRIEGATQGSGVLYKKDELYSLKNPGKGFIYEVITAWHVIKDNLPGEEIIIITPDNEKHYVDINDAKQIKNFDFAVIKFKSKNNYKLADYGNIITRTGDIYVSGFPLNNKNILNFNSGKLIAETNCGEEGYSLLYSVATEAGMSGGAVLDQEGRLIGIHGRGEIDLASSEFRGYIRKTGVNLGLSSSLYYNLQKYSNTIESNNNLGCKKGLEGFEHYLIAAEIEQRKDKRYFKKSIKYYDKAIEIGNEIFTHDDDKFTLANAYMLRGWAKVENRNFDGGIEDLKKANLIDPNNPFFKIGLLSIYLKDSKKDAFTENINKIIEDSDSFFLDDKKLMNRFKSGLLYLRGTSIFDTEEKSYNNCIKDLTNSLDINNKNKEIDGINFINNEQIYMARGDCFLKTGDIKSALNDYEKALTISPSNPNIYNKLGYLKEESGDLDQAIKYYKQGINLDPENELNYISIAKINTSLGKYSFALDNYKKAILLNPKNHINYYSIGELMIELNNIDSAIKYFTKAIEIDPTYLTSYHLRAKAKSLNNDYEGAIRDYSIAIEKEPKSFLYFFRGQMYENIGNTIDASKDYRNLIKLDPTEKSFSYRATFRYKNKDFKGAIKDLSSAIKLNPKKPFFYYLRAVSEGDLSNFKNSIRDINYAIKLDNKNYSYYFTRGFYYSKVGENKKAIIDYSKAIEINPRYAEAYSNRGNLKRESGDYSGAISDYSKAIALEQDNPKSATYKNRGLVKLSLSKFLDAKKDFQKASSIDPQKPELNYLIGTSNYQLEKHEESIVNFSDALTLDPNNHIYLHDRCSSKYKIGKYNSALKDCNLALKINPNEGLIYNSRGEVRYALGDKKGACSDYKNAVKHGYEKRDNYLKSEDGKWCKNIFN